ncbi:MAG TPA: MBL fold metallo-hydrolase [Anaerolineae bacterium]|nr:MBL fold metallo-hydrolase [Anaerolineae bacterium]
MMTKVLEKLYQIIVPTPFAVGPVNCYVALSATGAPLTLIDTGPRQADSRAALYAGLSELGLTVRDVRRIIITHAHADHYGLAAELVRECGAEVWTHPHNRVMLESYESIRAQRNHFYLQIMTESGVPAEERQRVADSRRVGDRFAESMPVAQTLDEGDRVALADRTWQVYHMPGHAGGLITFFDPDSRVLLSNDHLLREISSNPIVEPDPNGGPRPHRLVEYLHHLQRAVDLKPVVAWTSHGEPVHDVEKLVRQRMHFHERRAEKILHMIGDEERSAFQIAEPLFGRLNGIDSFLALSETIGHLDWLEEQGRVETITRDGVIYWRRNLGHGLSG